MNLSLDQFRQNDVQRVVVISPFYWTHCFSSVPLFNVRVCSDSGANNLVRPQVVDGL